MQRGFDVEFTDLEQRERFDLLASKPGMEIEIDCKSVSGDIGRSIHGRRFRDFVGQLNRSVGELARHGGGSLIHITIPDNLHGDTRQLAAEANEADRRAAPSGRPGAGCFRGRTRRYAFPLVRAPSGAGADGATPRRQPACVIFWRIAFPIYPLMRQKCAFRYFGPCC